MKKTQATPGTIRAKRDRLSAVLFPLLLVGLIVAGYQNTLENGFHFDDWHNILDNRAVRMDTLSLAGLFQAASESPLSYRPLPYVTFALD